MPHDKLKAAIRARMAATGEPYSVARRAVLNEERQVRWFDLRYDTKGADWITAVLDPIFSLGRRSGVAVARDELRVRAAGFEQRIPAPRSFLRAAPMSTSMARRACMWTAMAGYWSTVPGAGWWS